MYTYNYTYTLRVTAAMEISMPNKTIYVSDDDLPLFERAQAIAGDNLSSAIVRALRRFIEIEEARQGGLDEITVLVGTAGNLRRKRFLGVRLVRWLQKIPNSKGTQVLSVYRTARGRLALQTRTIPDWEFSWGDPDWVGDPENEGFLGGKFWARFRWAVEDAKETGEFAFEVFESLDELRPHIPRELYNAVGLAMETPPLEELDI
jgi:EXLDI family protein